MSNIKKPLRGNDTIDAYPLIPKEAEKILCVTPKIFAEINRAFQSFRKCIKTPEPQNIKPKQFSKPIVSLSEAKYQNDYEPTNAIYVNECDYRRWCRVSQWFKEFGPEADKLERNVLIQ